MILVEKDETSAWIKRMHSCLNCYREYLLTLKSFEKKKVDEQTQSMSFDCVNEESNELIKKIECWYFMLFSFHKNRVGWYYPKLKLLKKNFETNSTRMCFCVFKRRL